MTRIVVTGAGGRMGGEVCRAVDAAADLTLAGGVDPSIEGTSLGEATGTTCTHAAVGSVDQLDPAEVDVVVDGCRETQEEPTHRERQG